MAARRNSRRGRTGTRHRGAGRKKGRRTASARRGSFLGWAVKWALTLGIWAALIFGGVIAWFAWDSPDISQLRQEVRRTSVVLHAADGSRLASYGDLYGQHLEVSKLPPALPAAVVAIEDRRFYDHPGFDIRGLVRAFVVNIAQGRVAQGGSTITQQLAKNLFLTPERSIERKIKELILAVRLDAKFTKDELLTLYLNRVYLGAGTYGVEAAAQKYFGHSAREVTLYESAMLAGLLRAPSRYNPAADPAAAHARAVTVLDAMVDAGFVAPRTATAAAEERSDYRGGEVSQGAGRRYYADWILEQVSGFVGLNAADVAVETTFDARLQALAEQAVARYADEAIGAGVGQVALVAMTPDGAVRAMIGGRDYRQSQFNRATQARRQPGSAFKPFVYLAAFEQGYDPDSRVEDAPLTVDGWSPRNFGGEFRGEVTLREAMALSLNSVAVRLLQDLGPARVTSVARRLGITGDLTIHPSLALGSSEVTLLELTGAYATFANGGFGVVPYGVREIRGPGSDVFYRRAGSGLGRVVDNAEIRLIDDVLGAVIGWGTGKAAAIGRDVAGKTGTSQDFRDALFVGYSNELIAGVWLGNDDGTPMRGVTGGGLPARIWQDFMAAAHKGVAALPLSGGALPG